MFHVTKFIDTIIFRCPAKMQWQNFETSYVQSERVLDNFAKSDLSKFKICMADTDHAIHAFFLGGGCKWWVWFSPDSFLGPSQKPVRGSPSKFGEENNDSIIILYSITIMFESH